MMLRCIDTHDECFYLLICRFIFEYHRWSLAEVLRIHGSSFVTQMSMPICSLLCAYVKHGYLAFVDSLLRKDGADVNMKDQAGFVSIHHAVMHGHLDMVKLLINNNADINIDSASGMTAIMLAVDMGHEDIVKTLCEYKPDLLDMYYDVGDTMVFKPNPCCGFSLSCQSLNYGLLWPKPPPLRSFS